MSLSSHFRATLRYRVRLNKGFSLVELLTVIVVISILAAAGASVIPSELQSNQVTANVSNLAGMLEEAREAALSSNTCVYVLFSNTVPTTSSKGVAAIILESQDGTDALNNFATTSGAINSMSNIMVFHKAQLLPGIQLYPKGTLTSTVIPSLPTATSSGDLAGFPTTALNLTSTIGGATYTFTQGVMFKPDGEAVSSGTWSDLIEFAVEPIHQSTKDVTVMRLTRLTGKLTIYRQ